MASTVTLMPSKLLTTISTSRRQSQILDRWAARQAREMITTIDRQIHDAELSALSTTTQPVSARAASFLRESSSVSSAAAVAGDIPPVTVRASSLIQMWRELEADVVLPSPRSASEIEINERRKVGDIVRMLSSKEIIVGKAQVDVDLSSPDDGGKVLRVRRRRGMEIFVLKLVAERRREVAGIADRRPVSRFPFRGRIQQSNDYGTPTTRDLLSKSFILHAKASCRLPPPFFSPHRSTFFASSALSLLSLHFPQNDLKLLVSNNCELVHALIFLISHFASITQFLKTIYELASSKLLERLKVETFHVMIEIIRVKMSN